MGGHSSKVTAAMNGGRKRRRSKPDDDDKPLEDELKEGQSTPTTVRDPDPSSPSPSPSPTPSPLPFSAAPSYSPSPDSSPVPSSTLRRRLHSSSVERQVTSRSYDYFHEAESSEADSASHSPPPLHPRRRFEWLHRRHFFLLSLLSLLSAFYLTNHTPEYLPEFSAYLPDELQSSLTRLQALVADTTRPGTEAKLAGIRSHFPVILIPGIISTALEVWEGEPCASPHFRQRLWGSSLMLRSILLDTRCWMRHMMLDAETGMDPPGIKLRSSTGLEAADYIIGGFWVWAKVIQSLSDVGYDTNSMFMAPYDWRLSFKHLQVRDWYLTKLKAQMEFAKVSNRDRKVVLVTHSMGALVVHYFLQWVQSPTGGNGGDRWVDAHIESIVNIGGPMLGVPKSWSALFSGEMKDTAELAPFLDYWRQRVVFSQADVIQMMRAMFSVPSMMPKGGDVIWGDDTGSPDDFFCKKYADVTRLLLSGGKEIDQLDEDIVKEYCDVLPDFNRASSRFFNGSARGDIADAPSNPASPAHSATDDSVDDSGGDVDAGAAQDYAEGRLKTEPTTSAVSHHSFADLFEDSILRHPSRWFTSHKAAQPYVSARGSPRGTFVTFTSEHPQHDNATDDLCVRAGGCDMPVERALQLLRDTAPRYMRFIEALYSFGAEPRVDPADQRHWSNPLESPLPYAPDLKLYCLYGVGRETERGYMYRHVPTPTPPVDSIVPHWAINTSHTRDEVNIRSGVKFTDGDGTVPLISLGYMCSAGWKGRRLNPGEATIVTREYLEVNATMAILRAATSTDHVDIMGNSEIIRDLIRVVGVKRKGGARAGARVDEDEKARQMEARKESIDQENEGTKEEEKGPKSEGQRAKGEGAAASRGEAEGEGSQGLDAMGAGEEGEWEYTYIGLKDRVLSCVREISAEAQRRWLLRYGSAEEKEELQSTVEGTRAQAATQDPYRASDKGRKPAASSND